MICKWDRSDLLRGRRTETSHNNKRGILRNVVCPVIATSLLYWPEIANIGHIFIPFYPINKVERVENIWPNLWWCLANICYGFVNESHTQPTGMRSDTTTLTVKYDLMKTSKRNIAKFKYLKTMLGTFYNGRLIVYCNFRVIFGRMWQKW